MAEKPNLNLVIIGHVDHGKSTLVGRILLDTGQFPKHMVEKFREEAKAKGKESFALAWIFDNLKEERERGVTIDVAHKRLLQLTRWMQLPHHMTKQNMRL